MRRLQELVDLVSEDYALIEEEIARELGGEGWTEIPLLLEQEGYAGRLARIRERIQAAIAEILRELRALRRRLGGEVAGRADELLGRIAELQTLRAQLLALLDRLDHLVEMAEQKAAAAAARGRGVLGAAHQAARGWVRAIRAAIVRVSSYLWEVVQRLLYLKEWAVKGSIGAGLLGLASAELALTFGRDPAPGATT